MRKTIIALAVLLGMVLIVMFVLPCHIGPVNSTGARMEALATEARLYRQDHGCYPPSLGKLPSVAKDASNVLDSWGNPIEMLPSDPDRFVLRSYGDDGAPGGTDSARDLVGEFDASDDNRWRIKFSDRPGQGGGN